MLKEGLQCLRKEHNTWLLIAEVSTLMLYIYIYSVDIVSNKDYIASPLLIHICYGDHHSMIPNILCTDISCLIEKGNSTKNHNTYRLTLHNKITKDLTTWMSYKRWPIHADDHTNFALLKDVFSCWSYWEIMMIIF